MGPDAVDGSCTLVFNQACAPLRLTGASALSLVVLATYFAGGRLALRTLPGFADSPTATRALARTKEPTTR